MLTFGGLRSPASGISPAFTTHFTWTAFYHSSPSSRTTARFRGLSRTRYRISASLFQVANEPDRDPVSGNAVSQPPAGLRIGKHLATRQDLSFEKGLDLGRPGIARVESAFPLNWINSCVLTTRNDDLVIPMLSRACSCLPVH
jgi:hypothetical protein